MLLGGCGGELPLAAATCCCPGALGMGVLSPPPPAGLAGTGGSAGLGPQPGSGSSGARVRARLGREHCPGAGAGHGPEPLSTSPHPLPVRTLVGCCTGPSRLRPLLGVEGADGLCSPLPRALQRPGFPDPVLCKCVQQPLPWQWAEACPWGLWVVDLGTGLLSAGARPCPACRQAGSLPAGALPAFPLGPACARHLLASWLWSRARGKGSKCRVSWAEPRAASQKLSAISSPGAPPALPPPAVVPGGLVAVHGSEFTWASRPPALDGRAACREPLPQARPLGPGTVGLGLGLALPMKVMEAAGGCGDQGQVQPLAGGTGAGLGMASCECWPGVADSCGAWGRGLEEPAATSSLNSVGTAAPSSPHVSADLAGPFRPAGVEPPWGRRGPRCASGTWSQQRCGADKPTPAAPSALLSHLSSPPRGKGQTSSSTAAEKAVGTARGCKITQAEAAGAALAWVCPGRGVLEWGRSPRWGGAGRPCHEWVCPGLVMYLVPLPSSKRLSWGCCGWAEARSLAAPCPMQP